ncbi:MAG: AzlD domain-containing protein [Treponema sp.]|nr:AzlD domain-containing protein [Treponema sp.]
MTTGIGEALLLTLAMGATIFFCRVFPFLFFQGKAKDNASNTTDKAMDDSMERRKRRNTAFLSFVEKTVPPVAMTVLTFNSLAGPIRANLGELVPVLTAGAFTAIVHLWRRNPMISIFTGTALYMVLIRVLG